jgi:hypothetical protein
MLFLNTDYSQFTIPIIFVAIIIIIIVLSYFFSPKQVVIRKLSKLQLKRIGSLRINEFSKISGKALSTSNPLIAPYSKRKCVFYSIKIEQKKKSGKNSKWKTIVKEDNIQGFFIEKNGDFVIVSPTKNPKNYMSYLVKDAKVNSGSFNDPSPKFNALLKHYNINNENFFGFNKTLRYTEGVIEIGEQITVAGLVKSKTLDFKIEGYNYSKIMELQSSENQKIIITDLPNLKSKRRI